MISAEERAKRIDLGDGTFCCDRAMGGICYEHRQIAQAISAAVGDAIKERYSQAIEGHIYVSIREFRSEFDSHIRRYYDAYLCIDTLWGFWDECDSYFYAGYKTAEEALVALREYAERL